jgi:hypothetical protein
MLDIFTDMEVQKHDERIKALERQVKALKKYIIDRLDLDKGDLESIEGFEKDEEEQTMTPEELEYYVSKIEMYSDVFSYGRVESEGKKMAESL